MMLKDKVALVYGAGGIGRTVASAYAKAGARVFLASRSQAGLALLRQNAPEIETAVLDATDEQAVERHVDAIAGRAGRLDISFNAIGYGDVQRHLMEISLKDILQPITTSMQSQFLTTRAAARHMIGQKSGVVLAFGGGGPQTLPGLGGFKIALDALEGLRRQWAVELGKLGIRFITIKSGGVPDSISSDPGLREQLRANIEADSPMGRAAELDDVGNVAVFAASDHARTITDTWLNIGCGSMPE